MSTAAKGAQVPARMDAGPTGSRRGLWAITAVLGLFLFAAAAPTPLYAMYATRWGFTSAMLTVVFAVYAAALLVTLLVAGSVSDAVGRRPVILAALTVQSLSMVTFLVANNLGWLLAARIGQGVATGLATSAVPAALVDYQPSTRPGLGSLLNTVTPMVGLALGSLAAGALVQYAPDPLRLVYALMLAGFVMLAAVMLRVPETVGQRRPVDLRPRVGVEPSLRAMFLAALPCIIACWALGGLYLSLGPSLIAQIEHSANHLLGGAIAFALCAAAATAGLLVRDRAPQQAMHTGCAMLLAGLAITIAAIILACGVLLLAGSAVAGAGFGCAFLGAFRSLVAQASPRRRGEVVAALYVVAYLAFSVPAVAAGMVTMRFGLRATTLGYAAIVAVLAACSLAAARPRTPAPVPHPSVTQINRKASCTPASPTEGNLP